MAKFGYIRVSTLEQHVERQVAELLAVGVDQDFLYIDKASGKDTNRPQFQELMKTIRQKDELVVSSLDRLGRNYDDILVTVKDLRSRGVKLTILDASFLNFNTGNPTLDKAMFDMFLSLLSYISQNEREKILERQRAGIEQAKLRGVYKGQPPRYCANAKGKDLAVYQKVVSLIEQGVPKTRIAAITGISRGTVYKIAREVKG
jgi:DNA invertase Pin-like site-specific DNA recombinase